MKTVRRVLGALLLVALLAGEAAASCTTTTIFLPGGRMQICTTCCDTYGNCTVTCL